MYLLYTLPSTKWYGVILVSDCFVLLQCFPLEDLCVPW